MAQVTSFGFFAQLRSDASHHVIRYRNGRVRQSGPRFGLLVQAGNRQHRRGADG